MSADQTGLAVNVAKQLCLGDFELFCVQALKARSARQQFSRRRVAAQPLTEQFRYGDVQLLFGQALEAFAVSQ